MIKLVVLDLDGAVADTMPNIAIALNRVRQDADFPPMSEAEIRKLVGRGARNLLENSVQTTKFNIDIAVEKWREYYYQDVASKTTLYPGVADGLRQLREKKIHIAMLTNKPENIAVKILEELSVAPLFEAVIGGGNAENYPLKPAPDGLLALVKKFAVTPAESVMFGDNWTDIETGFAAGAKTVFTTYGYGKEQDRAATARVDSFAELVNLVLGNSL